MKLFAIHVYPCIDSPFVVGIEYKIRGTRGKLLGQIKNNSKYIMLNPVFLAWKKCYEIYFVAI